MARETNTEKAAARSASRPAVRRGDAQLGAVDDRLKFDAMRWRALARETRVDMDEEGGLRLVTKLPPLPSPLEAMIRDHIRRTAQLDVQRDRLRDVAMEELLVRQAVWSLVVRE